MLKIGAEKFRGCFYGIGPIRPLKVLAIFCWIIFASFGADANNIPEEDFDELLIYVRLPKYGGSEIPAAIREEKVYLSVRDLFDFLEIKNELADLEVIQGFILNQHDTYTIDPQNGKITYQGKDHILPPSALIKQDDFFYLNSNLYGEIFGLDCSFNFRSLSVTLTTQVDLPVFRKMRQEMMRKNLNRLNGTMEADTVYVRKKSMAKLQMADWAVMDTRQLTPSAGGREVSALVNMTRFNLSLGGELAHGEVFAHLNFFEGMPIQHRNQFYQWRHVNNDNQLVRQVSVGTINTPSITTILAPIVGLQVTNASTLRRKSFGSYRITDHTEPEWLVELYVNQIMMDFVRADAAGLYTFDVPLIYGNTNIQLKFYGPYGEEQTREQFINIPFNFLPKKELEYSLSSGRVDDEWGSLFSRGNINYGLSRHVTIGGGVEHLSSLPGQTILPFLNTSVKVSNRIMVSGDYMPNVRLRGLVNYMLPSNMNLDISYTKLNKDQQAIVFNYLEERKIALTMPINRNNFSLFSRFSLTQMVFPNGKFTNAQLLLSSRVLGIPTNFTTFGSFRSHQNNVHSMVSQTYRLPLNISLMPQVQYNYSAQKVSNVMVSLEKRVSRRGFFNLFYQNNLMFHNSSLGIGFRYDFSFSNVGIQARQSNGQVVLTQTARGSMMYDGNTQHLDFNNKVNVGKGAITLLPFLDLNANGKKDKNETLVSGLKLKVKGGQVQYDKEGEAIRITNLVAYEDYFIELDKQSFDQVAWRIINSRLKVRVDPNQFKKIEIPVSVMGEAAGMVFLGDGSDGIGGIKMNIYNGQNVLIHSALTERDGYFSYMELAPGEYRVRPDSVQLQKLGYIFKAKKTVFTMAENREGDYLDDLEFTLNPIIQVQTTPDSTPGEAFPDSADLKVQALADSLFAGDRENDREMDPVKEQIEKTGKIQTLPPDFTLPNGVRFTLLYSNPALLEILTAKSLEEQMRIIEVQASVAALAGSVTPSTGKNPEENLDSLTSGGGLYKIQLMATKYPLENMAIFDGLEGVEMIYEKGLYKYFIRSNNSPAAIGYLDHAKKRGFRDAFIIFPPKVQESVHVPTTKIPNAQDILKTVVVPPTIKDSLLIDDQDGSRVVSEDVAIPVQSEEIKNRYHPDTHFKIQIRASDKMLDQDDPVFQGVKGIDFHIHKGQYKYTYGIALRYREAVELLSQVKAMGFKDAFIVSFYKRRRLE